MGIRRVASYAERLGVHDDMQEHLANVFGARETTLLDMVA